jgi:hypothetical protein
MSFVTVNKNKKKNNIGVCSDTFAPEFIISIPIAIFAVIFTYPILQQYFSILLSGVLSVFGSFFIGIGTFYIFSILIKPIIINHIKT